MVGMNIFDFNLSEGKAIEAFAKQINIKGWGGPLYEKIYLCLFFGAKLL
jgi:hypothetical protein